MQRKHATATAHRKPDAIAAAAPVVTLETTVNRVLPSSGQPNRRTIAHNLNHATLERLHKSALERPPHSGKPTSLFTPVPHQNNQRYAPHSSPSHHLNRAWSPQP